MRRDLRPVPRHGEGGTTAERDDMLINHTAAHRTEAPIEAELWAADQAASPRWLQITALAAAVLTGAAIAAELLVTIYGVIDRAAGGAGVQSSLDLSYISLTILAFVGGGLAYHRGMSPVVLSVVNRFCEKRQQTLGACADWLTFAVSLLLAAASVPVDQTEWHSIVISLGVSEVVEAVPLSVGALFTAVFALGKLRLVPWRERVKGGLVALAVLGGSYVLVQVLSSVSPPPILIAAVVFCLFFVYLGLGTSIAYAMALVGFAFMYVTGAGNFPAVPSQMSNSAASSYLLLAIPFFVWAGLIMARGGPSQRIADLLFALFGRFRGGAMQTVIYSMFVFSGISGSKIADMAMIGTTLHETAAQQGYSKADTGAFVVASAAMGETIPPSIVMLLLGSVTSLSVISLFAAGILPAAVLAIVLSSAVYVQARRRRMRTHRFGWRAVAYAVVNGIPSTVLPVVLVVGIVLGIATPTEVSAFAVAYGLLLVMIVYRSMSLRGMVEAMSEACAMSGMLLLIAAAAGAFAWAMAVSGASGALIAAITAAGAHVWVFWVVGIAAMIVLGCVIEGGPAILIFGPLLIPVAATLGINQIQFGICLIIAYGLGFFAPPFGAGLFMASAITEVPPMELSRRLAPLWLLLVAGLVVVCAVPPVTLALPHVLGLPGT